MKSRIKRSSSGRSTANGAPCAPTRTPVAWRSTAMCRSSSISTARTCGPTSGSSNSNRMAGRRSSRVCRRMLSRPPANAGAIRTTTGRRCARPATPGGSDGLRRTFSLFDAVRIDHFRGFESAWEIDADEPTAIDGHWEPGPGRELFDTISASLGRLPIIVEDLGIITPEVRALRDSLGYPGMAVLQFAFGDDDTNPYLPHNQVQNQVVFTGTHDNDTTLGWYTHAPEWERDHVRRYLSIDGEDIVNDLIRCAYRSIADTALIPMQDVLQLGSEARTNVPGRPEGNWSWRFTWDQLDPGRPQWLADLARETGRSPVHGVAK